ncbi:hypothetical protein AMI01nite_14890 [Aneurinibacillus migulanus]|nr:hypothetical protein AMI01nite_14890 [Aneurinibacillus migulanus]
MKIALYAPTSFNMQSGRIVVLMDAEHEKFWDIVKETLRPRVPEENLGYSARMEPSSTNAIW